MKYVLFIILAAAASTVVGQTSWTTRRDSLWKVLRGSKEDTNKAMTMLWLGVGYVDNQPDSAAYYAKAMLALSDQLHYPAGMANGLSLQAMLLSNQNKEDDAIALDLEAIEMAKKSGKQKMLANLYNNTAIIYDAKGDLDATLEFYLKAAAIYEKLNDSSSMAFIYSNIASVYNDLKEYKNGYAYALRGILLCRSLHQTHGLGAGMVNLSTSLINFRRYDTALIVLNQTRDLAREMNDKNEEVNVLGNLYYTYLGLGRFDLIKPNAERLRAVADSIGNKEGVCYSSIGLTRYYLERKDYIKAKQYALDAIKTAKANNLIAGLRDAYQEAGGVELEMGDIPAFHHYDDLKDSVDGVIFSDKILKNTQELETKYSLNKKQTEIDNLNKQEKIAQLTLRAHKTMNWVMAGVILVTLLIGFMYSRNYRQKKRLLQADALLQQQRITELEKEKQLLATQAILQGQVEERTRLAKDLHDGLGSILSSTKYSFAHMKENLVIPAESAEAFEKSMGMLDKSISELRRVAHNMMPEALMKFGLDTALRDFCNSIDQSGAVRLTYQSFEMDEASIPKITASAVYRIVQELVNNILRHAHAQAALVQLVRKDDALSITVEDDGKGFDPAILQGGSGIGYLNLGNRVAFLNGTMDIQSAEGKGTSVNIEILNLSV